MRKQRNFKLNDNEYDFVKLAVKWYKAQALLLETKAILVIPNPFSQLEFSKTEKSENLAYTPVKAIPKPNPVESDVFIVSKTMAFPRVKEFEKWMSYQWVFTKARENLVKDFNGQAITLETIIKYVQEQANLIE